MVLVMGLLQAGCAGQPEDRRDYLLRPQAGLSAPEGNPVRLEHLELAPYLQQRSVVVQVSDSELHLAQQHRWAEPLDGSVRRYLQTAIERAAGVPVEVSPLVTGSEGPSIRVRIHQLHGDFQGTVRLQAEWTVTGIATGERRHVFTAQQAQDRPGYEALVAAHAELLDRLAAAIAETLPEI